MVGCGITFLSSPVIQIYLSFLSAGRTGIKISGPGLMHQYTYKLMQLVVVALLLWPLLVAGWLSSSHKLQSNYCRGLTSTSLRAATTPTSVISLTDDNGVRKEVINSGSGKKIETGDILAVEYVAMLLDTKEVFAKGDKEQFIVNDGSLIKGWDIAVNSMKIGEKARFIVNSNYAYGGKGVDPVIPANSNIEIQIKVLAWLGNQLAPESLFQKDLDIDPFIASTPESIQAEYEEMQSKKMDKYQGGIVQIYLNRLKNISFGFGGSGFFVSQSGEKAPWYLNPNFTFPAMITIVLAAFLTVTTFGGIREKGVKYDPELSSISSPVIRSETFKG